MKEVEQVVRWYDEGKTDWEIRALLPHLAECDFNVVLADATVQIVIRTSLCLA